MKGKFTTKTIEILNKRVLEDKFLRALVLVAISTVFFSFSYAYWTGIVTGNESSVTDTVTTSELTLNYSNTKKIELESASPGDKVSKTFTVKNDGDSTISYNILWDSFTNTFEDVTDLVYDLEGNTKYFYNKQMPDTGNDITIADHISIEPNTTHTYTLTIKYLNKDEDQNDNTGKTISGKLRISTNQTTEGYGLASEIIKNNTPTSYTTTPGSAIATTDEGLISGAEDNDGATLYFRGNVQDNYVSFANKTWRVMRINGDGTVRMILNGTTGTEVVWNSQIDSSYEHNNQTSSHDTMVSWLTYSNSPIKTNLETWYSNNIGNNNSYKKYVVKSKFCSDLTHVGTSGDINIGTHNRLSSPSFKCPSIYTYNLNVATLNADEALFAGAKYRSTDNSCYLHTELYYWSMSPSAWIEDHVIAFAVDGSLFDSISTVGQSFYVRPVINLKGDTLVTVNATNPGTSDNPYVVVTEESSSLGTPGNLKFSNLSTTGVKVIWDEAANAIYYKVERKTGTGSFITVNNNVSTNEYSDSGLSANTSYTYRVQACNSSGCNDTKKTSTVTTSITVGTIASFTSSNITGESVNLSWSAATNASYYKLERKTGRESYYFVNQSINGLSITDTITNGLTSYTYRIRGCSKNDNGVEYCGEPTTVNVTTDIYIGSTGIPTLSSITNTTSTIEWTAGENATYYKVARKASGESDYTELSNNTTTLNFSDSGLTAGTTYIYRIISCANISGVEKSSDPTYFTITTSPSIGEIATLSYSNLEETSLTLNWSSASNATYYKIERKLSSSSEYTTLTNNTANLNYADSNLSEGTSYDYKVSACSTSSTNTEYCGTSKTLTVRTKSSTLTLANAIIANNPPSTATTTPGSAISTTDEGLISGEEDDDGDVYYFRGNVQDNYVSFAGKTWRVMRINGDGTVRMILNGTTGTNKYWNTKVDSTYSNAYKTNSHSTMVSWLTYSNSPLKTEVESWYSTFISSNNLYSSLVATTKYCSDLTHTGTSKDVLIGTYSRISAPTFKCPSAYMYSLNVATINADEVLFAGGKLQTENNNYYLYTGLWYWTMSPSSWSSASTVSAFRDNGTGDLRSYAVYNSGGVRPVISLKSNVLVTGGTGTSSDPYTPSLTLADTIIGKAPTSTGTINSEGLMKVSQSATGQTPAQTEYRYTGSNVNNYLTFNNETWRIIGVFSTDDGTGTYQNRVRIIRDDSIGNLAWNSTRSNDWTQASLKAYLNGTYYDSLTSTAKTQIDNAKWYIAATSDHNTASAQYTAERASTSDQGGGNTNWTGKIALMYPSDYGYASSGCYTGTKTLSGYNNSTCYSSDWMYKSDRDYHMLSPYYGVYFGNLIQSGYGYVSNSDLDVCDELAVRPVSNLKSNVIVTGGSGTSSDPYTITTNQQGTINNIEIINDSIDLYDVDGVLQYQLELEDLNIYDTDYLELYSSNEMVVQLSEFLEMVDNAVSLETSDSLPDRFEDYTYDDFVFQKGFVLYSDLIQSSDLFMDLAFNHVNYSNTLIVKYDLSTGIFSLIDDENIVDNSDNTITVNGIKYGEDYIYTIWTIDNS